MRAIRQFDRVLARFCPTRLDDLSRDAADCVGRKCEWRAMWEIEEGPYAGQWAFSPQSIGWAFTWAPFCDLEILDEESKVNWLFCKACG